MEFVIILAFFGLIGWFIVKQVQRIKADKNKAPLTEAEAARHEFDFSVQGITLEEDRVKVARLDDACEFNVAGATAEVARQEAGKRMTATRIVGGAVLAGPIGAIGGALLRKDKRDTLVVTLYNPEVGSRIGYKFSRDNEQKAYTLAQRINEASAKFTAEKENNEAQNRAARRRFDDLDPQDW